MYKNFVFDLYGTLVDIHTEENKKKLWKKMSLFYSYYGALYTPKELKKAYLSEAETAMEELERKQREENTVWRVKKKRDEEGNIRLSKRTQAKVYPEIDLLEVFQNLFQRKGVRATAETAMEAARAFRLLSTDHLRLYAGAKELLQTLKDAGGKLYLLSNAQACFTMPELKSLGLLDFFDAIYISSDCSCKKPDRRFLEKLLTEQQLKPEQTILIGNEYHCDIKGARKAGLSTLYIRSNLTPKGEACPQSTYVLEEMDMEAAKQILLR